jgi:hypothetical protein
MPENVSAAAGPSGDSENAGTKASLTSFTVSGNLLTVNKNYDGRKTNF